VNRTSNHTSKAIPDLKVFSIKGLSQDMRAQLLRDVYVMDRLAIMGQVTVFYAAPNTGKTLLALWMLDAAIAAGRIDPDNLFYVNADDTFRGLIEKTELGERSGFHVLAPGHGPEGNEFHAGDLLGILQSLIALKQAKGKIVVLDTIKKFSDLMDKRAQQEINNVFREFVSNGGTIIGFAHVNKHPDAEGKPIPAGTSDLIDDIDCSYILYEVDRSGDRKVVVFENRKLRGDVLQTASYSYDASPSLSWIDKFNSIKTMDELALGRMQAQAATMSKITKNADAIEEIMAAIRSGCSKQSDILHFASQNGVGKDRCRRVLKDHIGEKASYGQFWTETTIENNAKVYALSCGAELSLQKMRTA
jgi:hypothetical protein